MSKSYDTIVQAGHRNTSGITPKREGTESPPRRHLFSFLSILLRFLKKSKRSRTSNIIIMASADDCFGLLDSGLSAIDLNDQTGDGVITIHQSRCQGKFPLMRLPQELRLHIISFLLPDVEEIDPGNEWDCTQDAGSGITDSICTTYRKDGARCEMAIMRTNREVYQETSRYLYDRITVIVHVEKDGVNFLTTHWGCGVLVDCFFDIPLQKAKRVWLQIHGSSNQARELVHVRRNLKDFCSTLYQLESLKSLRVDFWDSCHFRAGTQMVFEEAITTIQGGIPTTTIDTKDLYPRREDLGETSEWCLWRMGNSTGSTMASTDMELILQPLRLLRNVGDCQIFLNVHLQNDAGLMEMVAHCKEVIESTWRHTIEDIRLVHDTSEELGFYCFPDTAQGRMDSLLWQTRRWHSIQVVRVKEWWDRETQ